MSNPQVAQAYLINQINSASPLDLLIMGYDAALIGCGQRDLERTTRALTVLREALDYSYDPDIALGFFRLYQYCADLARKGEYDEAAHLLRELRDAWVEVRTRFQQPVQPPTVQMAASFAAVSA
ncbi:MAG TPA: flagellar protein FliS [Anaerolineae bacterium]|nr:flagellar protein FliS [Anaerolineae bacterium]HMR65607.1 flagellar protein FliS [Anaerolineae bacterium]